MNVDEFEKAIATKADADVINNLEDKVADLRKLVKLTNLFLNESFKL